MSCLAHGDNNLGKLRGPAGSDGWDLGRTKVNFGEIMMEGNNQGKFRGSDGWDLGKIEANFFILM